MTTQEKALSVIERLKEDKKRRKEIKAMLREAREQNASWVKIKEEMDEARARLKRVEQAIDADYKAEVEELEKLNLSIKNDNEVLSDIALTMLMKGENIDIQDSEGNKYEPKTRVTFKQLTLL